MEAIQRVLLGLEEVGRLLDDPDLDPDPARTDWAEHRGQVKAIEDRMENEVLRPLSGALGDLSELEHREAISNEVARVASECAALFHAARIGDARGFMSSATSLSGHAPQLEAAYSDMDAFTTLVRARWMVRHDKGRAADRLFAQAVASAKEEALKTAARDGRHAPRPIRSAPPLFRLNGFGAGLYGSRDRWEDGSHVKTYCVSALWIPVFPLSAYRVIEHENDSYSFYAKERLSTFARGYRALVLAAAVAVGGTAAVQSWWDSPGRQSSIAMEAASEREAAGDRVGAIHGYEELVLRFEHSAPPERIQEAGAALTRLHVQEVPSPLTAAQADAAHRAVARWRALPERAKKGAATELMVAKLTQWGAEVGTDSPDAMQAALRIYGVATAIAPMSKRAELAQLAGGVRIRLAEDLSRDWPVEALEVLLSIEDPSVVDRAAEVLKRIAGQPSLIGGSEPTVQTWLGLAKDRPEHADLSTRLTEALAEHARRDADEARTAALAERSAKVLAARLSRDATDQEVLVELAQLERERGKGAAAEELLSRYGGPGYLVPEGQQLAASLHLDAGRLEQADLLLSNALTSRVPKYQAARSAYEAASVSARESLNSLIRREALPPQLLEKLRGASDEVQGNLLRAWFADQLEADPNLLRLQAGYERYGNVVPLSLMLGMTKLRRAAAAADTERARLLGEAERAFLAIREDAAGVPAFHLGLGQVYHRLGKTEEGEAELTSVIDQGDPWLTLSVVNVYRELGMIARGREVGQRVFDTAPTEAKERAAVTMSLMSNTIEDREMWLKRASSDNPFVRIGLLQIEADRSLRAGDLANADRMYAKVATEFGRTAKHDASAANNQALALQSRFACTGDKKHLEAAVAALESALRLEPDSALITGNLADVYEYGGRVELISRFVRTPLLRPSASDAEELAAALFLGPLGAEVIRASAESKAISRCRELSAQEQVLAPESARAWERELEWAAATKDTERLRALEVRLARIARIDDTQTAEMRAQYARGEHDTMISKGIEGQLKTANEVVRAAREAKHAPTLAAALFLKGRLLVRRVGIDCDLEAARGAVAAQREAVALWPELGAQGALGFALYSSAFCEARGASPKVLALWDRMNRTSSLTMMLQVARSEPEAVAALCNTESMQEGLRVRGALPDERLDSIDWVAATLAGDAKLTERARTYFARPEDQIQTRVTVKLSPSSESAHAEVAMFAQNGVDLAAGAP